MNGSGIRVHGHGKGRCDPCGYMKNDCSFRSISEKPTQNWRRQLYRNMEEPMVRYIKIGLAFEAELFRIRLISIRGRLYLYIRLCIIISIFIIIFSFITACTDIRYLCLTGSVFLINSLVLIVKECTKKCKEKKIPLQSK